MKSIQIKKELEKLDNKLRNQIAGKGISESSNFIGLKRQDLSAWMNGRRKFSWEKIIEIAERLGL